MKQNVDILAISFRKAIEEAINNNEVFSIPAFKYFPNGCCDDACDLLAFYLKQHFIDSIKINGSYVGNDKENYNQHHVWLQVDDFFVDITGDQFKNNKCFEYFNISTYVGSDNDFYSKFSDREIELPFDFINNDSFSGKNLYHDYLILKKYL